VSGRHVPGVLVGAAARVDAIGDSRISSSAVAASNRMIGHEGSNSERRTLNVADRG